MTEFKDFRLGDVLIIQSSKKAIHKNNIKEFNGVHPYVTRTSLNNGIDSYIDFDTKYLNAGNTISLGLDTYVVNYQVKPYFTGNKVKILVNPNLNKYNALYLITNLYKVFQPYSWGTGIDNKVLGNLTLNLPVKSLTDTEPDWEYMEQYIKDIEKKAILKVKEQNEKDIALLKDIVGQEKGSDFSEDVEFREFLIDDLFTISRGLKTLKPSDRIIGAIPYINSSVENQGIAGYVGNPTILRSNSISIGLFGKAFYQEGEFTMANNTYSLENNNLNKYTGLYICSILEKIRVGYGFGYTNPITKKSLIPLKINLPINKRVSEQVPDWNSIEEYMKHIQQKYIILKEQENEIEINNLLSVTGLTHEQLISEEGQFA